MKRKPDTARGADLAFISYQRLPKNADPTGFLEVPPELVIEARSGEICWAEMEARIGEYHVAGVDLIWVVDPRTLTLQDFRGMTHRFFSATPIP